MKILYLEGRPRAHHIHRKLAEDVVDDVEYIDPYIRWQDKKYSFFRNLICWLANAISYRKRVKEFDALLVDNLHFTPVLYNLIFPLAKKKLIVHLGSHTLYFIATGQFTGLNRSLHKWILNKYDAMICEGEMAEELVKQILNIPNPPTYVSFLGPSTERYEKLIKITPKLDTYNILIIANGPGEFRRFYKGLDVMLAGFELVQDQLPHAKLTILGDWSDKIREELGSRNDIKGNKVNWAGIVQNIDIYLKQTSLCIHCSRGDAFPTSTLEAMAAGIPVLVSKDTGTREVVKKVDESMIVDINAASLSSAIIKYYALSQIQKEDLSARFRAVVSDYTFEKAVIKYRSIFNDLEKRFT